HPPPTPTPLPRATPHPTPTAGPPNPDDAATRLRLRLCLCLCLCLCLGSSSCSCPFHAVILSAAKDPRIGPCPCLSLTISEKKLSFRAQQGTCCLPFLPPPFFPPPQLRHLDRSITLLSLRCAAERSPHLPFFLSFPLGI